MHAEDVLVAQEVGGDRKVHYGSSFRCASARVGPQIESEDQCHFWFLADAALHLHCRYDTLKSRSKYTIRLSTCIVYPLRTKVVANGQKMHDSSPLMWVDLVEHLHH